MQARKLIIGAALLAACGGNAPTSPPGTGTPTTVAIQAGNNQTGAAGAALPVQPAVLVKDQDGKLLAGVPVVFSVESGGGSIAGSTTVSTASNGVAQAGQWTVGSGGNTVKATVSGVAPVTFSATGIVTGGTPLADATIPASGGIVTVSKAGDPLNGTKLTVPSGSFPAAVQFTIAPATVSTPVIRGVTWVSPVVNITSSNGDYATGAPFMLDLPAAVAVGYVPVAVLMNGVTGTVETAPAVAIGSGTVRLITRHLNSSMLAGGATPLGSSLRVNAVIQVVIGQVKYEDLVKDITTSYNPLLDDWDFPVTTSFGPTEEVNVPLRFAYAISALSWFRSQGGQGAQHLGSRFDDAPGVWQSNERALRLAEVVGGMLDTGAEDYNNALATLARTIAVPVDSLQLLSIKSAMYVTGHPQLMEGRTGSADQGTVGTFVAYGSSSAGLKLSHGMSNNILIGTSLLRSANGTFVPMTITAVNPETDAVLPFSVTVSKWLAFGESAGVPFAKVDALWDAVRNRTIGGAPPIRIESNGASRIAADTIVVWSTGSRFWGVCDGCSYGYTPSPLIAPTGTLLGERVWIQNNGNWEPAGLGREAGQVISNANNAVKTTPIGVMFYRAPAPGGSAPNYVDWRFYFIKYVKLSITPAAPTVSANQPFTLTATYSDPAPNNARWRWEMGDGRTITTTTNTLTTTYPSLPAGSSDVIRTVKVTLDSTTKVWATATTTVTVSSQIAWRFTSATLTSAQLPPGGIGIERSDTLINDLANGWTQSLTSAPGNSLLFLFQIPEPSCRGLYFEQFPPGQFAPVLDSTFPGALKGFLGSDCPPDPSFTWSLTMSPLGTGTLVASAVNIPQPEEISLPGGSINASMSGRTLSGSFTLRVRYSTGIALNTYAFQATQVLPPP
ncbi:MAG: PKD domain-containing protein, partial [Gemmatimonadales bacterium]